MFCFIISLVCLVWYVCFGNLYLVGFLLFVLFDRFSLGLVWYVWFDRFMVVGVFYRF